LSTGLRAKRHLSSPRAWVTCCRLRSRLRTRTRHHSRITDRRGLGKKVSLHLRSGRAAWTTYSRSRAKLRLLSHRSRQPIKMQLCREQRRRPTELGASQPTPASGAAVWVMCCRSPTTTATDMAGRRQKVPTELRRLNAHPRLGAVLWTTPLARRRPRIIPSAAATKVEATATSARPEAAEASAAAAQSTMALARRMGARHLAETGVAATAAARQNRQPIRGPESPWAMLSARAPLPMRRHRRRAHRLRASRHPEWSQTALSPLRTSSLG